MWNVSKLQRVITALDEHCHRIASEYELKFNATVLAEYAYPKRKSQQSRKNALSQLRRELTGSSRIKAKRLDELFMGYRRCIHGLAGGEPDEPEYAKEVLHIEEEILNQFGLAHLGERLSANMFAVPTYESDSRTRALAEHDPRHIRQISELIMEQMLAFDDNTVFSQLCHDLNAQLVDRRPESADLTRHQVLGDSIVYDNTDWELILPGIDLKSRPIQPCYSTRVLRILVTDPNAKSVSLEMNTNGFAVIPVPARGADSPDFRVYFQDQVCMTEAPTPTRTTYIEYELFPEDLGREREIILHSIFYNGLQDSFRDLISEDDVLEWHGKRVAPETGDADMAVILPGSPRVKYWKFNRRPERANRDETQDVDQRERILESSPLLPGSLHDGLKAIWKMPSVDEPTIFSFQWCWD